MYSCEWSSSGSKCISVVGSGVSLSNLSHTEISQINGSKILRANWFFQDDKTGISRSIHGWFFGILEAEMLAKYKKSGACAEYIMTPIKSVLESERNAFDVWTHLRNVDWLCKKHLLNYKYRNGKSLPTTGMVMLSFAASMNPDAVLMCGIDFYRTAMDGRYTYFGRNDPCGNPLKSRKPHDIETEIHFLASACSKLKTRDRLRVLGNPQVEALVDQIFKNIRLGQNPEQAGRSAMKGKSW